MRDQIRGWVEIKVGKYKGYKALDYGTVRRGGRSLVRVRVSAPQDNFPFVELAPRSVKEIPNPNG